MQIRLYWLWYIGLRNVGGIQLIVRVRFTKTGYLRYLSHLDLVRLFTRVFSRSELPVRFTEGFNPHPKFSIGNPLSLGIESLAEYMEIDLDADIDPKDVIIKLNSVLPEGIKLIDAIEAQGGASLSSLIKWSHYEIRIWIDNQDKRDQVSVKLDSWSKFKNVFIDKKRKKGKNKITTQIDIIPLIGNFNFQGIDEEGFIVLSALLKTGEEGNLKPSELIEAMNRELDLGIDLEMTHIKRIDSYIEAAGNMEKPI